MCHFPCSFCIIKCARLPHCTWKMKVRKTSRQRTLDLRTLAHSASVWLLFMPEKLFFFLFAEESESMQQNQRCVWILCQNLASPPPPLHCWFEIRARCACQWFCNHFVKRRMVFFSIPPHPQKNTPALQKQKHCHWILGSCYPSHAMHREYISETEPCVHQ